jgi:hypothetical protein
MTLKHLTGSASLFPFQLKQITAEELALAVSRLDVIRHNLDDELVIPKTQR